MSGREDSTQPSYRRKAARVVNVIAQVMRAGLVDAFCFNVIPAVLGAGVWLFENMVVPARLRLTGTRSYNGMADLMYERV